MKRSIYLASSWRNAQQPEVLAALRAEGHEVYDFRHPSVTSEGFHWSEIDPDWRDWSAGGYVVALTHPFADRGFDDDWSAMLRADTGVLLLPSGRSAHLEAGYFVGAGKPLYILLADPEVEPVQPELMYRMGTICLDVDELRRMLRLPG